MDLRHKGLNLSDTCYLDCHGILCHMTKTKRCHESRGSGHCSAWLSKSAVLSDTPELYCVPARFNITWPKQRITWSTWLSMTQQAQHKHTKLLPWDIFRCHSSILIRTTAQWLHCTVFAISLISFLPCILTALYLFLCFQPHWHCWFIVL